MSTDVDVVIVGAGLAGLSLARHLQLATNKRVLLLERRTEIPPKNQKVGESLVQVGGYYFAKVLDMEEHLLHEHFMKYNLRFYFKTSGRPNDAFEDYGQAYIRNFSNIPCYQLDRNVLESELLRLNLSNPDFELIAPAQNIRVQLSECEHHKVEFVANQTNQSVIASWVIDTTGRARLLARQNETRQPSPIQHGAAFMWVDGLVDVEKLTDQSPTEVRRNRNRKQTGHLPHWLATNHFMFEGGWFWVIPLRGKTSLGVVYDQAAMHHRDVSSPDRLRDWVCREFPLFSRDLEQRQILDFGAFKDFAYDCKETINSSRWAMSGESGRFTDPLYSPGSDFIALHNTLIVDAIQTNDDRELKRKCVLYEILMKSLYGSLLPTYSESYDVLGDEEVFSLKYTWELSVYFAFFVYPFMTDLSTDTSFLPAYFTRFSRLGGVNKNLHVFLCAYYQWKKWNLAPATQPVFHDFTKLAPLRHAEKTFYHVDDNADEAILVLDDQLASLSELARFSIAHVYSVVLGDAGVVKNASFIESIDLKHFEFDVEKMRLHYDAHADSSKEYDWKLDPRALDVFKTAPAIEKPVPMRSGVPAA